jgi:hypothetical protein
METLIIFLIVAFLALLIHHFCKNINKSLEGFCESGDNSPQCSLIQSQANAKSTTHLKELVTKASKSIAENKKQQQATTEGIAQNLINVFKMKAAIKKKK